ncbi:MAG TPA: type VI secretion system domain-containing protein, partial [Gemmatimonadales bacterium]|nr:type VI secretion system domain-containing protein [Gemmatimonadales bacterium]
LTGTAAEGEAEEAAPRPRTSIAAPVPASSLKDRVLDRALAEVKAGRAPKALEVVKRELDRETSERGRFLRQAQLARVMVEAGLDAMAIPLLEQLQTTITDFRLEEWELGSLVAEPLVLLYRCLEKQEGDPEVRQSLYLRICRLDPVQALGFGQATAHGEAGA